MRTVASFDFEASGNQGWSVAAPNDASTGNWEVGDPVGTTAQPENDNTPGAGTRCWFTGQGSVGGGLGANDVDGGRTTLLSPVFDLDGAISGTLSFARWYSNDAGASPNADVFEVDLSADGGATWTNALTVGPAGAGTSGGWIETTVDIGASIPLTADVRVRFIASDLGSGSIVEAAIDDVAVFAVDPPTCPPPANYCVGGVNGFGTSATMAASGSQDVDDQDLTLGVFGAAPSQFGLFFYGPPCLDAPRQRHALRRREHQPAPGDRHRLGGAAAPRLRIAARAHRQRRRVELPVLVPRHRRLGLQPLGRPADHLLRRPLSLPRDLSTAGVLLPGRPSRERVGRPFPSLVAARGRACSDRSGSSGPRPSGGDWARAASASGARLPRRLHAGAAP